jgi:hypothetical protein
LTTVIFCDIIAKKEVSMKRFGFFSLIFLLVLLSITACSGEESKENDVDSSVSSQETSETASSEQILSEDVFSDEYVSLPFVEF